MASRDAVDKMVQCMVTLNGRASELMQDLGAHACTDITGFGFIGHSLEMALASQVGFVVQSGQIPFLPKAMEYGNMGLFPAGAYSNREYFSCKVEADSGISSVFLDLLYDPQTSGGLLVSLPCHEAEQMVKILRQEGHADTAMIGEVTEAFPGKIKII